MTYTDNSNNGEILQTVEAERSPLRWLWWVLGALVLGGLVWALTHSCTRQEEVVVEEPAVVVTEEPAHADPVEVPEVVYSHVNIAEDSLAHLRTEVTDFNEELSEHIDDSHLADGFRHLCAAILNGTEHTAEEVAGFFGVDALEDAAAVHLTGLVNNSWCVRP